MAGVMSDSSSSNPALNPMVYRRARSYEDLLGVSTSKIRALDIKYINSFQTCGVWRDRPFLDQTAFINDSSPLYENGDGLEELLARYAMSHNLPFRNPMDKMPLQVITLPQYPTRQVSEFSPFAEIALAYFNCVQKKL
ncbi:uncharacterized protein LOC141654959 [Silene latifolia]|uniref:uncharacterized protein LOC141654959 n=1 Tax=Silene latifolia TaxID=37657 RepID=UPI003D77A9BA